MLGLQKVGEAPVNWLRSRRLRGLALPRRPGTGPLGVDKASPSALRSWKADQHRRPPVRYVRPWLMTHVSTGRKRRRRIEELELIHGFPKDYTY